MLHSGLCMDMFSQPRTDMEKGEGCVQALLIKSETEKLYPG